MNWIAPVNMLSQMEKHADDDKRAKSIGTDFSPIRLIPEGRVSSKYEKSNNQTEHIESKK